VKKTIKQRIAKATSNNSNLNKKSLQLKRSWDEVEGMLQDAGKTKKR